MKIVSWNVNSIRIRLAGLKQLIDKEAPDIICLQETKTIDELFPYQDICEMGYNHITICGEKSYNGVAVLSKIPFNKAENLKFGAQEQTRHNSILIDDIEIHNFYIPAGGDIPDPLENPKFANKLTYLDEMTAWFEKRRMKSDKIIILGDFNIAPLEHDVWSHKQLLKEVSHTPIEIEKLSILKNTLDWCDIHREFVDESKKLYSWWSYRNRDWRKSDRGRRLDHIWCTPAMKNNIGEAYILKDARDWIMPSDHVPVVARFNI